MPKVCVVTGGSGFVGQRLVEMLVERGAKKVISFDIAPKPGELRVAAVPAAVPATPAAEPPRCVPAARLLGLPLTRCARC